MPSLRKRPGGSVPIETAPADPTPAPLIVPDAEHALAATPPGMSQDEAVGILADAQADVGAEMAQPTPTVPGPDSDALKDQLQALQRAAEARERIQFAMSRDTVPAPEAQPQQPIQARVQFTPAEIALNQSHPDLLQNAALAQVASITVAELARLGHTRGSPEYENRIGPMFEHVLANARQRSVAPVAAPAAQPAPAQTEQPEPESNDRRIPVSAPVSRETPSSITGRPPSESRVTLSAAERGAAKDAGISEVEYARQKLKLEALKRAGHYKEQ